MRYTAYKKQGAPDLRSLVQQETYAFYMRNTVYKKQGAPDRCSTHLLLLSACLRHIQKARGSIGMCSKIIILLIKFSKVFAAQRVSSSLCIIQTISHQIPIRLFNILLVYSCYQYTRSKGIYLYLSSSSSSSM
jgi:hypothetical protein